MQSIILSLVVSTPLVFGHAYYKKEEETKRAIDRLENHINALSTQSIISANDAVTLREYYTHPRIDSQKRNQHMIVYDNLIQKHMINCSFCSSGNFCCPVTAFYYRISDHNYVFPVSRDVSTCSVL
jgi:Flp pilus assembly protein TadB